MPATLHVDTEIESARYCIEYTDWRREPRLPLPLFSDATVAQTDAPPNMWGVKIRETPSHPLAFALVPADVGPRSFGPTRPQPDGPVRADCFRLRGVEFPTRRTGHLILSAVWNRRTKQISFVDLFEEVFGDACPTSKCGKAFGPKQLQDHLRRLRVHLRPLGYELRIRSEHLQLVDLRA